MPPVEVVITGVGVVSPNGIGKQAFWESLAAGRSGIAPIELVDVSGLPVRMAGEVKGFQAKSFIANRKSLKVMSRDSQLGIAASVLAVQDAGIAAGSLDPNRVGIVLGADRMCSPIEESEQPYLKCLVDGQFQMRLWGTEGMATSYPLAFLRVLPNMIASHLSIVHDARGPCNTIHHAEISSLLAISEAARVIERGSADVMLTGGASSQMNPFDWARFCATGRLSPRQEQATGIVRPFDRDRDGEVIGEGAAVFVLESRAHAEARGATILARVAGYAAAGETRRPAPNGAALERAVLVSLQNARITPNELGHINAHGLSTIQEDRIEAAALRARVPGVPVTAPKSYFGNLGAASGAMELAVSVLALGAHQVPATLNYESPDPACPVDVIHGQPLGSAAPRALVVNRTQIGQAAALVLAGPAV